MGWGIWVFIDIDLGNFDLFAKLTRDLIEDGKQWALLDAPIELEMPIRILQGMQAPDVPWEHAFKLVEALQSEDVVFSLIKDGDHRLSRDQDIERLVATCGELAEVAR